MSECFKDEFKKRLSDIKAIGVDLNIIDRKKSSKKTNVYRLGKKSYRPKELFVVIPAFVVLTLVNAIGFGVFYFGIKVLSGQLSASHFYLKNSFVCLLIVIGALFSAAELFLKEIERFEKDEHCHFSIVRLTSSEAKEQQVRSKIDYWKSQYSEDKLTIKVLEKREANRQEKLRDYPTYIYVLAGISAFLNWLFRQIRRCFMMIAIFSFCIVTLLHFNDWQDTYAIRQFFSENVFVLVCLLYSLLVSLIAWFIKFESGKRCAISYFWTLLDHQQLKKYGIVPYEPTEDSQREEKLLKHLKLRQQANRKNLAK